MKNWALMLMKKWMAKRKGDEEVDKEGVAAADQDR